MKADDFKDKVMQSIITEQCIPLVGDWSLFAFLGDTEYHVFIYRDCADKFRTANDELDSMCSEAYRWFNNEGLTTMLPPFNPRQA